MSAELNCSIGAVDIRDYTLIDALRKISQEKNKDLQFAIWNLTTESEESEVFFTFNQADSKFEQATNGDFRGYKLIQRDGDFPLDPFRVFIPLNCHFLQSDSSDSTDEPPRLFLGQGFRAYEMDVNDWSPVEDQSPLHLCAANAAVSLIEYCERVADGRHLDASRLFLHQAACHLSHLPPTAGPSVRSVVAALATFGVPPESSWPYDPDKLEVEPPAWCYAQARNYRATSYFRLDRPHIDTNTLIAQIKILVYSGIPAIFGFSVHEGIKQAGKLPISEQIGQQLQQMQAQPQSSFSSITNPTEEPPQSGGEPFDLKQHICVPGNIPFPIFSEVYYGGHAAVVMGYDDEKIIVNRQPLRRHDRERLRALGTPAFVLTKTENGQWQGDAYEWRDTSPKGYYKKTNSAQNFKAHQFLHEKTFNDLFILLVSETPSEEPLVPKDILFEAKDTVGKSQTLVDEYVATKGAFKIRNSWGKEWGDQGYGWLPYAYVYQHLTFDWWSVLKFEWMNTDSFGLLRQSGNLVMCTGLNLHCN